MLITRWVALYRAAETRGGGPGDRRGGRRAEAPVPGVSSAPGVEMSFGGLTPGLEVCGGSFLFGPYGDSKELLRGLTGMLLTNC